MKSFRQYLLREVLSPQHRQMMQSLGYEYEDEIVVGDMELYLLYGPMYPEKYRWHLGFQRQGMNVFDIDQQFSRDEDKPQRRGVGMMDMFKTMQPMLEKIHAWTKEHGQLVIASTNERLTEKWANNLVVAARYLDIPLHLETVNFHGHTLHLVSSG